VYCQNSTRDNPLPSVDNRPLPNALGKYLPTVTIAATLMGIGLVVLVLILIIVLWNKRKRHALEHNRREARR